MLGYYIYIWRINIAIHHNAELLIQRKWPYHAFTILANRVSEDIANFTFDRSENSLLQTVPNKVQLIEIKVCTERFGPIDVKLWNINSVRLINV